MITKLELRAILLFNLLVLSVLSQNCDKIPSSDYQCLERKPDEKCMTFAILRANSHYSSLSNLSSSLSIARADLVEANGFSNDVEFLSEDEPVLIPIECKCSSGGFFEAEVEKISIKGESFYDIAESLEGLTSCNAIREKNPSFSPWNVPERINVLVPLKCACPASVDSREFLVSYPVKGGDTVSELCVKFNVTQETLVSTNSKYSTSGFRQDGNLNLVPVSTLLIPIQGKPVLDSGRLEESSRVTRSHKRRRRPKMWMIGVFIAMGIVGLFACIAVGVAFFVIQMKKRREEGLIMTKAAADMELPQLSLSIRTTSDKKVSFEGSQYNLDEASTYTTTPHKMRVIESYTFEDLHKATEGFSSSNLIQGSLFHGRLKGKNMAIKRISSETVLPKIDYEILHERSHRHPNIMRLMGTCLREGEDSFLVFEYARNGSLKDWIHGGLAIKSHFIASCSCFLTWNQRVKICLDVATALQHMHLIMNPAYVHKNIRSRNIFLDEDFTAKVGNFGLVKLADDQDKGYLPPECLTEGAISPSSDVFAYGVVLLEVLSGKPPTTQDEGSGDEKCVRLSDEIKRVLQSEDAEELRGWIDSALGESYSFDAAVMLANLARSCVEDDASSRPNAGEIVEKLLRLVEELPERDQFVICESSCKPLVNATVKEM
ncbi:hypothetical protein C2S52_001404 [Perilla frutescens var. hirtella]|nr:hypothetical protein C2S52_001404 [Perilla frutescens var. hirtella]